jgi:hypothetical protein
MTQTKTFHVRHEFFLNRSQNHVRQSKATHSSIQRAQKQEHDHDHVFAKLNREAI